MKYTRSEIREWLCQYLARLLDVPAHTIDPTQPFEVYGLDSSGAVGLSGDLEDLLGVRFDSALVYDHPTVERLAEHLVSLRLVAAA